jgi:hypothetical protein
MPSCVHVSCSVRNNIRDGHIDYAVTADSWPNFCYANFVCDTNDIEKGLWKSTLLVKVKSAFLACGHTLISP